MAEEEEKNEGAPEEAAAEAAAPAEPEPALSPKERRHRRRMKSRTEVSPATPEERKEVRARKAATRSRYRAKLKERRAGTRSEAPAREADEAPEHGPGRPKVRQGVVVSAKPDKTITVRIDVARRHRRYGKILRTSTSLHVHDERNDAHEGDTVRIVESPTRARSQRPRR